MIIGLNGHKGAGKDAACARLTHLLSGVRPVKRLAFADPLKQAVCVLLGVTIEQLEEWKSMEHWPMLNLNDPDRCLGASRLNQQNMRQFLQRFGMMQRDLFGENFWIDQAMRQVEPFPTLNIITDVRLDNEAEAIQCAGGQVWCVVGSDRGHDDHVTEAPLAPNLIDHTIVNWVRDDDFATLDWSLRSALEARVGVGADL